MKKLSIILTCALLAIFSGSAFAEKKDIGMYAKLGIGYADYVYNEGFISTSVNHFEVSPAFGITNLFPIPHFALEGFCNLAFGGKDYGLGIKLQSIVVTPGARAVWAPPISFFSGKTGTWQDRLIPYVGAGLAVPICFTKSEYETTSYSSGRRTSSTVTNEDTKAYFDVELQFLCCRWAFNDHWSVFAENNLCFGGIFKYSFIAGGIYTF